jgi:CBS-domain-containing membrane protein
MSSPAAACQLEDPVEAAARLMAEKQIRRIPIIDEKGACVGIISQADLLSSAATDIESIVSILRQISAPRVEKAQEKPIKSADKPATKKKKPTE